jgi:hypothetical protein
LRENKPKSKTGDDDSKVFTVLEILQPELAAAEEEEERRRRRRRCYWNCREIQEFFVVLEIAEDVVLELEHIHRQTQTETERGWGRSWI